MADSYNPPNRWRYVYLRQGSIVEEGVLSKSLIKRIKNGTLSRSAELSGDGIHWARVDQYAQLISYFEEQKRNESLFDVGEPASEVVAEPDEKMPPPLADWVNRTAKNFKVNLYGKPLHGPILSFRNGSTNGAKKNTDPETPPLEKNKDRVNLLLKESVAESSPASLEREEGVQPAPCVEPENVEVLPEVRKEDVHRPAADRVPPFLLPGVIFLVTAFSLTWFFPQLWAWGVILLCAVAVFLSAGLLYGWKKKEQRLMQTDSKFAEEHVQLLSQYFCETVSNEQARDGLRLKLANHWAKIKKKTGKF